MGGWQVYKLWHGPPAPGLLQSRLSEPSPASSLSR